MAETDTPPTEASTAEPAPSAFDELVIITGFSGAGKSTAMNVFEDAGYFCVDNLPPEMIRGLIELFVHEGAKVERAAVVSDVRGGEYFEALRRVLGMLGRQGIKHRVLFLDAEEQTLVNRYKETRRRHPLAPTGSVVQGIARERELLDPVRPYADAVIDTTGLAAATLRRRIASEFLPRQTSVPLALTFSSFGFKHGPPRDADLTFDVRFLPNPHWEPDLKPLTGFDSRVVEYVAREGKLEEFYALLVPLLDFLIPQYEAEGKAHLSVAIGCTGGRHRSVAIAEHLGRRYGEREDLRVEVTHRDVEKGTPPR
ncbi:MAG: RNase adapter RapZ [Solirubrobacteraceae bacterium]